MNQWILSLYAECSQISRHDFFFSFLFQKTIFLSLQLIGDWFGVGPWLYCTIFDSFPCGDVGVDKLAE